MFSPEEIQTKWVCPSTFTTKTWSQEHPSVASPSCQGETQGKGRVTSRTSIITPPHHVVLDSMDDPHIPNAGEVTCYEEESHFQSEDAAISTRPDDTHRGLYDLHTSWWVACCDRHCGGKSQIFASRITAFKSCNTTKGSYTTQPFVEMGPKVTGHQGAWVIIVSLSVSYRV